MVDILFRHLVLDTCLSIFFNKVKTSFANLGGEDLISAGNFVLLMIVKDPIEICRHSDLTDCETYDYSYYGDVRILEECETTIEIAFNTLTLLQVDKDEKIIQSLSFFDGEATIEKRQIMEIHGLDGNIHFVGNGP